MDKNKFSIIFGLTADPIHLGHEQAIINGIEYCRDNGIEIEQFLLIPVFQPNLIANKKVPVASFEHRFHMCELVANRLSKQLGCDIQVSRIEKELVVDSGEKNYSYNTLRAFNIDSSGLREWVPTSVGMTVGGTERKRDKEKGENCLFMISADHFGGRWPKFRKWHKWREILQCSGLLINQRPGNTINHSFIAELRQINPNVFLVQNSDVVDVSSTEIRQGIEAEQVVGLLSLDVLGYIKNQSLY